MCTLKWKMLWNMKFRPALPFFSLLFAMAVPQAQAFDNALVQGVGDRPNPDYAAPGGRIGTFIVRPSLALLQTYDDNIFRESNKTGDFITEIKPSATMQTDWNLHQIKAGASANFGRYRDHGSEDYRDHSYFLAGRLDVDYGTYFSAELREEMRHEDRGALDDPDGDRPVKYTDRSKKFDFMRDLSILKLYISSAFHSFKFRNGEASGTVIDNSTRNRNETTLQARLALGLTDHYEIFLDGRYNRRKYDVSSTSFRNSHGYEVRTGMAMNITGITRGDIFVGHMNRNYDGTGFQNINALNYGGSLLWNITEITSLRAQMDRQVLETSLANLSGLVRTGASVEIEHSPRENIIYQANVEMNEDAYRGANAASRDNTTYRAGLGADYKMNPNMTAGLNYDYIRRDFKQTGLQGYNNNQIMFSFLYDY
jgi:hypothetical protein